MYLKDAIKSIDIKGTAARDSLVKIVIEGDGRILYEGKVRNFPQELKIRNWIVTEIIRMETWQGESFSHLPKHNRPYRIEVI